ncbi:hypothetical protein BDV98DRAFT_575083 [Pterulicium gracile]|uniref:Tubby C-terminal-like domain-containing protein n=1 Tax=Pterulicium gracile TaxID=1884261 RepID=A0A5C3Q4P3_9AGAR|nr:hypothetical protein BDV98DRAFT_575083 [Pterula gracilis]
MGLFSRKRSDSDAGSYDAMPEVLDRPSEAPVGLFSQFIDEKQTVVLATHINQITWNSEDRMRIMDASTGQLLMVPTYRKSKGTLPHEMCDTQGQTLFRMKLKFWSRTNTFHGLSATNEEEIIFTVKSDSQVTKLVLSFKNPTDGRETEISLQDHGVSGTLLYKNTGVFHLASAEGNPVIGYLTPKPPTSFQEGGASAAEDARKRNISSYVSVAPGVDATLLEVLYICTEEIRQLYRVGSAAAGSAVASSAATVVLTM